MLLATFRLKRPIQNTHHQHIVVPAFGVYVLAQETLLDEAAALCRTRLPWIILISLLDTS
jgi:hypothetical protein